jgi:hypothetical protein
MVGLPDSITSMVSVLTHAINPVVHDFFFVNVDQYSIYRGMPQSEIRMTPVAVAKSSGRRTHTGVTSNVK